MKRSLFTLLLVLVFGIPLFAQSVPESVQRGQDQSLAVSVSGSGSNFVPSTISIDPYAPDIEVSVFPNPVDELLVIKSEAQITSIKVMNMRGQMWRVNPVKGRKTYRYDVNTVPAGMYNLEIHTTKGFLHRKVTVRH